jgi:alpha-ribazole phosphatase
LSRLLMVRHGVTETNAARRFTGQSDIDLNDEGYRQAEKLRDRLAEEKIDAVYCSDLKRAIVTAKVICSEHELEIVVCPEIRELNYGEAEGLTYREIADKYPELGEMIARYSPMLSFPGGERFSDLTVRAEKFIGRLDNHEMEQTILIVTHGGMLRMLTCQLLGMGQEHWPKFRFDNASLTIIDTYPQRAILSLLNDTSHLKETGGLK